MQVNRAPYEAVYQKKQPRVDPDKVASRTVSIINRDYQYRQLRASNCIRLLKLHAGDGNEPLVCEITEVSLDSRPQYKALSYAWGDAIRSYRLETVSDGFLPITYNLYRALQSLRHANIDDGAQTFWVDLCCINQNDFDERNQQVRMMDKIYEYASKVICYIGEETHDSEEGLLLAHILQEFAADHRARAEDIRLHLKHLSTFGLPDQQHPSWLALRKILSRSWSTRIWISQEFALNKNLVLVCGDLLFQWNLLPLVVLHVELNKVPEIATTDPEIDGYVYSDEVNRTIGALKIMSFLRLDLQEGTRQPLLSLLRLCHRLESSEPRDKVYALLGLASDRWQLDINPDYSMSTEDVMIDVAIRVFRADKGLVMLGSVLPEKGIKIPSWVPDWTTSSSTVHLIFSSISDYHASGSTSRALEIDEQFKTLTLKGALIDKIALLSQTWLGMVFPSGRYELSHEWVHEQLHLLRNSKKNISESALEDAFWRTLIANRTYQQKEAPESLRAGFQACRNIWAKSYAKLRGYVDSHGNWNKCAISFDPLLVPKYFEEPSPEEISLAYDYSRSMGNIGRSRNLCVTQKGLIGLVPSNALVGDEISIFAGGNVPFVVRENAGSHQLIGEAYVHGIMKGEALEGENFMWQKIVLI